MAKIEVQIVIGIDTDEYVEPTPKWEENPRGFVRGLVQEWRMYGFSEESYVDVYCPQLEPRRLGTFERVSDE